MMINSLMHTIFYMNLAYAMYPKFYVISTWIKAKCQIFLTFNVFICFLEAFSICLSILTVQSDLTAATLFPWNGTDGT